MRERGQYHDFFAPIDGVAHRFCLHCYDGQPKWIAASQAIYDGRINRGIELVNALLKEDREAWGALRAQKRGTIAAVVEAAEARRQEIYGDWKDAA